MKQHCRLVFYFVVIAVLLPGCGKRDEQVEGKVTITFWHSFVSSTIPSLKELISEFEKEHPQIRIKAQYVPTGDGLIQKLVTAVQSNTAPDVSWVHSDFLDKLVEADAIFPMREFIDGENGMTPEEITDIFPALLESGKWRGKLYAMPMEATSLALLYNKEHFRKAGLDPEHPPNNWKELKEYATKLTVDVNGDGKTDRYGFYVPVFPASGELNIWMLLQWTPFLWQAGGEEMNDERTKILINGEAGVQALTFWKELYDAMEFSTFALAHDLGFASQKLAMVMDGPWNLPRYREMKEIDWAVAPLPAGPAGRATYIAGEQLAIFRQSDFPHEAWTFVKWILEPRIQAMFSMSSGYLPVRQSVLKLKEYRAFLERDLALKVFVEQMAFGRARRTPDYHRVEINRAIAEAIEKTMLGREAPQAALDEAVVKSNALLKSAKGGLSQ